MIPVVEYNWHLFDIDAPSDWYRHENYRYIIRERHSKLIKDIEKDPERPTERSVPPSLVELVRVADDYEKSVIEAGISYDLLQKIHASVPEPTLLPNKTVEGDPNPINWHPDISRTDIDKLNILISSGAIEDELLADKVGMLIDDHREDDEVEEKSPPTPPVKLPAKLTKPKPTKKKYMLTDTGNGERFADQNREFVRYCHPWKSWLIHDTFRWKLDHAGQAQQMAKQTIRSMYGEAQKEPDEDRRKKIASWAAKSESQTRRNALLACAQSEPGVPVQPEDLDQNHWLLNLENGTLNLKTGRLFPHSPGDLITNFIPIRHIPPSKAPQWKRFLMEILDEEKIAFLQRAFGYSLTGLTVEQCLFFLFGPGANGKSVFIETLSAVMGAFAVQADFNTFLTKTGGSGIPNDIARLKGARFVAAVECPKDQQFNEVLIKQLTGGDRIAARFLNKEFFEFKPTFKLWLVGNHRPAIRGTDHSIWRRLHLVEFDRIIPPNRQDKYLIQKLKAELPGILNWALEGLEDYMANGLQPPASVQAAVADYRSNSDPLQRFINDRCTVGDGLKCSKPDLHNVYVDWCRDNYSTPLNERVFGRSIKEHGFSDSRPRINGERVKTWLGISISDIIK